MSKIIFTLALSLVTLGFGSAQLLEGSDSLPPVVTENDNDVQEVEALVRRPQVEGIKLTPEQEVGGTLMSEDSIDGFMGNTLFSYAPPSSQGGYAPNSDSQGYQPMSTYNSLAEADDDAPPEEQVLPPVIDVGNGVMRYGPDGPGVRAVNTLVNFRDYTCLKVGCISVRPTASFPPLDNDYFKMYAIFTVSQPGIGPEDVIYFKSSGTLVPYLTSIVFGDEYTFIYSSAYSFDIDDTKQDRQIYIMCFDLPELPEVNVECLVNPDE